MASFEPGPVAASSAWHSLVQRSIKAWGTLNASSVGNLPYELAKEALQACNDVDDFLERLDDFVVLPATPEYITRAECLFLSHFWQKPDDPDHGAKHLQLLQRELSPQSWSYIWVDWSCIPQHPRTTTQETYFLRALRTMPGIIRNCKFVWRYPPFEARLWILYEIAEYTLTTTRDSRPRPFKNIKKFQEHIEDMLSDGVQATLVKHGYRCKVERDKEFLTGWLELLVLLTNLGIRLLDIKRILDSLTWSYVTPNMYFNVQNGLIEIHQFEGLATFNGERYTFTPFPERDLGGGYATSIDGSGSGA